MKRLNPDTGKPFVRGDTRADGFLFYCYTNKLRKDGFFVESWLNPEAAKKNKAAKAVYYDKNKEKINAYCPDYYKQNRERIRDYQNDYAKTILSAYRSASSAKRRAVKLQRTPIWLTKEQLQQIESVYEEAKQLTELTGIIYHVDHIVPLQGELVSGLHVPWNLRAIPATENIQKSNSFQVE